MKRILTVTASLFTAAMLLAGPAMATTNKVTCKQIRDEIATGKTPAAVAKELKVSQKTVNRCNAKVASAGKHTHSSSHSMQGSQPAQ